MRRKGFTIIELLIVIAVVAILVGIALPRFKGMQDEGNLAKAKGELTSIQAAVESYYLHNTNTYPTGLANLIATTTVPNIIGLTLPTDPFTAGTNYGYAVSTNGKYYTAWSVGTGGDGSAAIADDGTITETKPLSCIYVTNGKTRDTTP
jgi:prepilin-type N-terminal cleavage/methylation domain-containing protein